MNNYDLARSFSQGATKGKGSNMFIEENTIYSYGYHFPIARRYKDFFVFNYNGYSSSTAKHKSYVLSALSGNKIIEIRNCNLENAKDQIKINKEEIKNFKDLLSRARKDHIKEYYKSKILDFEQQNKLLRGLKK